MPKLIQKHLRRVCQSLNLVAHLTAENVALRQQLIVLQRSKKRPQLKDRDRLFWVLLSKTWPGWRNVLLIVQPDTVIHWHRKAFKQYWRRKSRSRKRGRPRIDPDVKAMVFRFADANPLWGAPLEFTENCLSLALNYLSVACQGY